MTAGNKVLHEAGYGTVERLWSMKHRYATHDTAIDSVVNIIGQI